MPPSSPTARQRKLGVELRAARERVGLSTQELADQLGWSQSKVSRIERARTLVRPADVGRVLDVIGVDAPTRARLIQLANEAQQRGWWVAYGDLFTSSYIGFEDVSTRVRTYETILIPGLLQTGRYARAVIEAGRPGDPDIDRRVQARRARQALLDRPDAPEVLAVIDEAALRRPVGGPEVMREQLGVLLDAGERRNVSIRVLPFASGAHGGMDGPFTILSFDQGDPDLAYSEGRTGNNYLESVDQVQSVTLTWERIWNSALSTEESAALIAALAKE
jgi:transcriptional regulator with XRE-family HTH domain